MTHSATICLLLAASYLLGSLPFGLWIAKKWAGVDIRTVGSGNIGSTNVGRICGPKAGAFVFTLDVLKGLLPPLAAVALHLDSRWQILVGLLAIIGHNYSMFLGFKGGKGIATSLGALIGIAPKYVLIATVPFMLTFLTLGFVSLSSVICAVLLPIAMPLLYPGDRYRLAFSIVACVMALYKHRANIHRLMGGREPKVHFPWDKKPVVQPNETEGL